MNSPEFRKFVVACGKFYTHATDSPIIRGDDKTLRDNNLAVLNRNLTIMEELIPTIKDKLK